MLPNEGDVGERKYWVAAVFRIANRKMTTNQAKQKNLRVFCCFVVLTEERLKESENLLEKFKTLFEALNDVTDSKHGISSFNYLAKLAFNTNVC